MLRWEGERGAVITRFTSLYFTVQHIVFGFGVLLLAVCDDNDSYLTANGYVPYASGLARLALINLVSLYAGLAGMALVCFGGKERNNISRRPSIIGGDMFSKIKNVGPDEQLLRRVCYVSIIFHVFILALQWNIGFNVGGNWLRYIVQVGAKVTPATFFFMGLLWVHSRADRWPLALYLVVYGSMQLATGGRAPILYGIILFFTGIAVLSPTWFLRPRRLLALLCLGGLLPWLSVRSEDLRLLYQSREPANAADLGERLVKLLGGSDTGVGQSDSASVEQKSGRTLFRFGGRLTELAALDVVARTPEDFPFWGWSLSDSISVGTGWLPAAIFPDLPKDDLSGVLFLRLYGWAIDPENGHSMPITMLGDSWRRFGWTGVGVAHFILGLILTKTSMLLRRAYGLKGIALIGALYFVILFSYTDDIVTFITAMPRRIIAALLYMMFMSVVTFIWRSQMPRLSVGGRAA